MGGVRKISGLHFVCVSSGWSASYNGLQITLGKVDKTKCCLHDPRDESITPFKTVTAAKSFAKRKRHGRSLDEHVRAEFLQGTRERLGWSIKTAAEKLGVSPRTIESWSSGARAVPKIAIIALGGIE